MRSTIVQRPDTIQTGIRMTMFKWIHQRKRAVSAIKVTMNIEHFAIDRVLYMKCTQFESFVNQSLKNPFIFVLLCQ